MILDSARKRDISDEDMLHAYRNAFRYFDVEAGMTMYVGGGLDGTPIEIGVVEREGEVQIVHSMRPARPKFLR